MFCSAFKISQIAVAFTIYIRFKQVEQYYRNDLTTASRRIFRLNRIALFFGHLSALGLSVVANFREIELFKVHLVGALMSFGFGAAYCWLQSFLSLSMVPLFNSRSMVHWRFTLSVIITAAFLTTCICGQLSIHHFHGRDPTNWKPEDGGYKTHIISSVSEWIAAMALNFFILSYTQEFQTFHIETPRVLLIDSYHEEEVDRNGPNSTVISAHESVFFGDLSQASIMQ